MLVYTQLLTQAQADDADWSRTVTELASAWRSDYLRNVPDGDLVFVDDGPATFLFDIANERLIAAWAVSAGRHGGERDKYRMAGHPKGAGDDYHRGHAIAHRLGGGTDINLVPQLGKLNIGAFRELERNAVATPGSLYFTHWNYAKGNGQVPISVDQGMLAPGQKARIVTFQN